MPKAYFNPFYLLSVVLGVLFLITAVAYGVMAFRGAAPHLLDESRDESGIMIFLARHGTTLFLVELGALMATTIAAIATDDFWSGRGRDSEQPDDAAGEANESNHEADSPREQHPTAAVSSSEGEQS